MPFVPRESAALLPSSASNREHSDHGENFKRFTKFSQTPYLSRILWGEAVLYVPLSRKNHVHSPFTAISPCRHLQRRLSCVYTAALARRSLAGSCLATSYRLFLALRPYLRPSSSRLSLLATSQFAQNCRTYFLFQLQSAAVPLASAAIYPLRLIWK